MMYALLPDGRRSLPSPSATCLCPICKQPVVPKCGDVRMWHFAHQSLKDCDTWGEGETLWHRHWKEYFPADWREVVMGPHRADVRTPGGKVVEFQSSPLPEEDVLEREAFYGDMFWVLSAQTYADGLLFLDRIGSHSDTPAVLFRWRRFPQAFRQARRPLIVDLVPNRPGLSAAYDPDLLVVHRIHRRYPCEGTGFLLPRLQFLDCCLEGGPLPKMKIPKDYEYLEEVVSDAVAECEFDRERRGDEARLRAYERAGR